MCGAPWMAPLAFAYTALAICRHVTEYKKSILQKLILSGFKNGVRFSNPQKTLSILFVNLAFVLY